MKRFVLLADNLGYRWPRASTSEFLLAKLSLSIEAGERVALLGRSGVGKTTLARIIAHLLQPSTGTVNYPLAKSGTIPVDIAFQGNTLFPWLTVSQNVAFGHRRSTNRRRGAETAARSILETVGLGETSRLRPDQLSGGMRQRVSVARAIFRRCQLTILDEPFSSLDLMTRESLYALIRETSVASEMAYLVITHLPEDAYRACTRSLIMNHDGTRLQEIAHAGIPNLSEYRDRIYDALQR